MRGSLILGWDRSAPKILPLSIVISLTEQIILQNDDNHLSTSDLQ